jgi:hypothetical protein
MPYNSIEKKNAANKKNNKKNSEKRKQTKDVDKYEQELDKKVDEIIKRYDYFGEDAEEDEVDDKGVSLKEIRAELKKIMIEFINHRKIAYEETLSRGRCNIAYKINITQKELDDDIKNGTLKY